MLGLPPLWLPRRVEWSGRECGLVVDGHKLDRGELAEAALSASEVVGPFDPGHDRQAEFLAGDPLFAVQDALLEQGEERLHGGVVTCRGDAAHRPDEAVVAEHHHELLGTKLTASVAMDDGAGGPPAQDDRHPQRGHGQLGRHPEVDGVADDPVRRAVLDRAEVDHAFHRPVLRDVDQPLHVDRVRGEVPVDAVVVNRPAGLLPRPAALEDARGDALQGTQALDAVPPDLEPHRVDQLIGDEPGAELRVVRMHVHCGVDQVRVVPVPLANRVPAPGVVRRRGEAEHPARHRDRDPLAGEIADQGIHHSGFTSRP